MYAGRGYASAVMRSVHKSSAPTFLPEWASRGDVWDVAFDLDIPPDRVQSPDIAVIMVDCETGEAASFELL